MQQRKRFQRYFLAFLMVCVVDECIIQRVNPMAPVAAIAVPFAYEVAMAAATAVSSLYGAYLVCQIAQDALEHHSLALPCITEELQTIFPKSAHLPAHTETEVKKEIQITFNSSAFTSVYVPECPSDQIKKDIEKKIEQHIITPLIEKIATLNVVPATHYFERDVQIKPHSHSPIEVSYAPNLVRVDFKHLNSYISVGTSQISHLTPLREQLIEQSLDRAIEVAITEYMFQNCPDYRTEFLTRFQGIIDVLDETNHVDPAKRIGARLQLPSLSLEEPFNYELQNVIDLLLALYYDADGYLTHLDQDFGYDRQFAIARFLKNGTSSSFYERKIRELKLDHVIRYEDSLGIRDTLRHIVTFRWVPKLFSDPRATVSNNAAHRTNLRTLLNYCKEANFVRAHNQIQGARNPTYKQVYELCYKYHVQQHCDQYGILKQYADDPEWASLKPAVKKAIAKDIHAITRHNAALAIRDVEKKGMQRAWQISDTARGHVHNALYNLIGYLGSGLPFIEKTLEIVEQYKSDKRTELIKALFLPSGVLKDFSHFKEASLFDFTLEIGAENLNEKLRRANSLLYRLQVCESHAQAEAIHKELHELHDQMALTGRHSPTPFVACIVDPEKNKAQEVSTCPPQEDEIPTYGCGLQMPPIEDTPEGGCLEDFPESEIRGCEIIGLDFSNTKTLCNWSKNPGIISVELPVDNVTPTEDDKQDDTVEGDKQTDTTIANADKQRPKEKKPRRKRDGEKDWQLPDHDPAIDFSKVDFSDLSHLTQEEIEFIKKCIKLFLGTKGFLASDGAIWRLLKHGDQKKGALFELEYAVELHRQNVIIIKWGEEVKIMGKLIEIDIETDTELIECKAGVWELKDIDKIEKLREKFKLAQEYGNNLQKPFIIVSRESIPSMWKNWFDENNIKYREWRR